MFALVIVAGAVAIHVYGWEKVTEALGLANPPSVAKPTEGTVQVHYIDVGQGDSVLILSEKSSILIDSGESKYADLVISYIKRMDVTKLDLVIATHPHSDHIGGMDKIIAAFKPTRFIMPNKPHTSGAYEKMLDAVEAHVTDYSPDNVYAKAGEVIEFDCFDLEIVAPSRKFDEINNSSVVARLVHGSNRFLFTGDVEREAEDDIVDNGFDISANVLKVAHHGSKTSSTRTFLNKVNGEYAVISVGSPNMYNHPNEETVKRLDALGYEILRTDVSGTIVFISDSDGVRVAGISEEAE